MIGMTINFEGDGAWPDLKGKEIINVEHIKVTVLEMGMASGRPSVAFRLDLPDGRVVIAQTSARLFLQSAKLIEARYPALLQD